MAAWSLFPYSNSGYADLKGIYVIKTTSSKVNLIIFQRETHRFKDPSGFIMLPGTFETP
jgi:hypothetical protein